MSADRPDIRAEYLAQGLPVCRGSAECHRAPFRRGLCRLHMAQFPSPRSPMGRAAIVPLKLPEALWASAQAAAARDGVSGAEWVRRAIGEALEHQTPASSGS